MNGADLAPMVASAALAGLVGSAHCAVMCGPLVAVAAATPPGRRDDRRAPWLATAAHGGGRGLAYTFLGAVAGTAGAAIDVVGRAARIQRLSAALGALALLAWAVVAIARAWRGRRDRAEGRPSAPWVALDRLRDLGPGRRGLVLGVASAVLPCGLLWMMVGVAAATGSALAGAATMAAFWLGGTPALAAVGLGARAMASRLPIRAPLRAATVLFALGLSALLLRAPVLLASDASVHAQEAPRCH